ncbi:MAG: tetratricopeptide repeat protein [Pirellulales bacterium]
MQRIRSLFSSGRTKILGGPLVAALAGLMLADDLVAQTRQRFAPRSGAPAAAPRTERPNEDDVMELPAAPIPSLNAPSRGMKTPDVELKDGEILIDGSGKLPSVQEVNAGNVLVKEAFKKSEGAKNEGDYSEIIALCEEGVKSGATRENAAYARKLCAWAYNRRGERFAELGNEQEAMKDFAAAINYDPGHWRAIHNRGVSHATLGRTGEALADFSRALQLNRNYANTWFNRAELQSDRGDHARAIGDYAEAIRLSPKEPEFYSGRGQAYARLGRIREAMQDLSAAIRLDPENAEALVSRAEIYLASRDWGRAASDYRDAIQLDDRLGRAYQGAAWIMATCPDERYRNDELALSAAQKALELDGDKDPRYIETLAAAYANSGQFDSAAAILQGHLDKMPQQYVAGAQARIQLYKSQRPYRSGPVAQQPAPTQQQQQQTRAPAYRQQQPTRGRQPVRQQQQAAREYEPAR